MPDIELIIQWRATCDMCTLWQRFGRAARALHREGKALFLVEPKHFDDVKAKKAERAAEKKRKAAAKASGERPAKRARTKASNVPVQAAENVNAAPREVNENVPVQAPDAASREVDECDEEEVEPEPVDEDIEGEDFDSGETTLPQSNAPSLSESESAQHPESLSTNALGGEVHAMRRLQYEQQPPTEPKRGKRSRETLDPAMDDMVNAGARAEIRCSRLPSMLYFGNDKTGEW